MENEKHIYLYKKGIMEKKNFLYWFIFTLLAIWQLPQFIVALVMWPFLGKKTLVADRHFNFCWKSPDMSGGISLGPIAFVSEVSSKEEIVAHEVDGHTVDSKIFGPLYLLIIGLPSIIWAWTSTREQCYYNFYTEKRANKWAGLTVDEYCHLHFKK